jgi:hypothetical protein
MPTQTDREIIKDNQKGVYRVAASISDPNGAIGALHEETFVFSNAAGSPLAEVGITMAKKCKVKSIRALPGATLAVAAANYVVGTIAKRDGAGGAATTIGEFSTEDGVGAALTAFTPTTVDVTASAAEIAAGGVLTYALVDAATTTEPAISVSVTVEYI